MTDNTNNTFATDEVEYFVKKFSHMLADLPASVVDTADGPLTKYVKTITDPHVIIEHGVPYIDGPEGRALTLLVRRADDVWVYVTYEHNDRWSMDQVAVRIGEVSTDPIHYTNSSAQWVLTGPLDEVRESAADARKKEARKERREAIRNAEELVEYRRKELVKAEERLAALKARK